MNPPDCIFCKVVAGSIPSVKLYEDEHVLAFMDIGPIVKGHALVIPKIHYDPLMETPDPVLAALVSGVRKIACAQMAGLKADGINVTQANGRCAGQAIPHIHFHVIPRFNNDGHQWNWAAKPYASPDEMTRFAERIMEGLTSPRNSSCVKT